MNKYIASMVIFLFVLLNMSFGQSLVNPISPSEYADNITIHYTPFPFTTFPQQCYIEVNGQYYQNICPTTEYFNFSKNLYYFKQNLYYYNSPMFYENESKAVIYNIPQKAELPFVDKLSFYNADIFTNNSTYLFFHGLYQISQENYPIMNLTTTNQTNNETIKQLANYVGADNFTIQLYSLYDSYSKICLKNTSESYGIKNICHGNETLPYYSSFLKFYKEIGYLFMSPLTPEEIKTMLLIDANGTNLFPTELNQHLINTNIQIDYVYPSLLPSASPYSFYNNSTTIIIPKYIKFSKDYTNIKNDYNSSIKVFISYKSALNPYSYYSVQTDNNVFNTTIYSGFQTYSDTCSNSSPGESAVILNEEIQNYKTELGNLEKYNLEPKDFISSPIPYSYSPFYSIIKAIPSNVNLKTYLIYGVRANGKILWENQTQIPINSSQNIIEVSIPQYVFNETNSSQIFARIQTEGSYQMSYYYFDEIQNPSTEIYNYYSYNKTKVRYITKIVNNQTIKVPEYYQVTCYVSQVNTETPFNEQTYLLGNVNYYLNNYKESYINVSTYLPMENVFKIENNTYLLNYTYVYSNIKNKIYTKVTLPLMTSFSLSTPNDTFLYYFDTFTFNSNLLNSTTIKNYMTSESKNLYSYNPAIVYPNLQTSMIMYIPTITNGFTNLQYIEGLNDIKYNILQSSFLGQVYNFLNSMFSNLLNGNIKANLNYGIISQEMNSYNIYKDKCLNGALSFENICVIPSSYYTIGTNASISNLKEYDLLDPLIYTQNNHIEGTTTPQNLYSALENAKGNILGSIINQIFGKESDRNITTIYINTGQLEFNTTWKGWSAKNKEIFMKYLKNLTRSNFTYSYMTGYANTNINHLYIENITINPNNTITITFNRAFSSLVIQGNEYNYYFTGSLVPTTSYLSISYQAKIINNSAYLFTLPNFNSSFNPEVEVKFSINNITQTYNLPKVFIVLHKTSKSYSITKTEYKNIPEIVITSPFNIEDYFFENKPVVANMSVYGTTYDFGNMHFNIESENLPIYFYFNSYNYLFVLAIFYIIFYIAYKNHIFDDLIYRIKNIFKYEQ
ncbi:MAG: hypothetical protein ACP5IV_07505 [Caldisericia bacterium]